MRSLLILMGLLGTPLGLWARPSIDLVVKDLGVFPARGIIHEVAKQAVWPSLPSENSSYEILDAEEAFRARIEMIFNSIPPKYRREFRVKISKTGNIMMDSERQFILIGADIMRGFIDGLSASDADLTILAILAHEMAHYYYHLSKQELTALVPAYPPEVPTPVREDMTHARVEMIACMLLREIGRPRQDIERGFYYKHRHIRNLYDLFKTDLKTAETDDLVAREKAVEFCLSEN